MFWNIILTIHSCPALNLMFGCITIILSWNVLCKMVNTLLFSHPYIIMCMATVFLPWSAHLFQFFCLVSLSIHLQKTASLPCFLFLPVWLFTEVTIIWSVLILLRIIPWTLAYDIHFSNDVLKWEHTYTVRFTVWTAAILCLSAVLCTVVLY